MTEDIKFSDIELQDFPVLQELAAKNGGNDDFSAKNFVHWYLKNPTNSYSLKKVIVGNSIEGYATTNNFKYSVNGKEVLVALPQNVLTSERCRGKGLFGKLYYLTENENLNKNKVDFFLTSTGSMSTPIFLSKFGYLRAICPDVIIKPIAPLSFFSKARYTVIKDLNNISISHKNLNNARIKNLAYFKWRYAEVSKNLLTILSVQNSKNKTLGYAVLITQVKKGIKIMLLADIICENENNYSEIIRACHHYASKKFHIALVMFQLDVANVKYGFKINFKNKYNFLIKGKDEKETLSLSTIKFNFFLGDLDYFW